MGKFLYELQWATQTPDNSLLAIGDPDDPTHLRKITLRDLRTVIKGLPFWDDLPESELVSNPLWTLEGVEGGWELSFTTVIDDALYYIIFYYDELLESWRAHPEAVQEVRDVSTEPLKLTVLAPEGTARVNRRFKIKTITAESVSELSSEKNAWSKVKCPANFVPGLPVIDTDGYPLGSSNPKYGIFGLSVTVKFSAPSGEADYIDRYEIMRQDALQSGEWPVSPLTWKVLPTHQVLEDDPAIPARKTIYYVDDSQMARAGYKIRYKIRAVARNGNKGAWTDPEETLLVDDTTPPDVPVLTAIQKQLMIHVSFNPPTQAGGPCPDFNYFYLEFSKSGGAWTAVPGDGVVVGNDYYFGVVLADIDATFRFRAKAYDVAEPTNNASAYSEVTEATAAAKVDTNSLSATVQSTLSSVSSIAGTVASHTSLIGQNAEAITLRATTEYVSGALSGKANLASLIAEINLSSEEALISASLVAGSGETDLASTLSVMAGAISAAVIMQGQVVSSFVLNTSGIRFKGASLELDGNTVFNSDVEIQGVLKSTGGIKTSTGATRIEIGKWSGTDFINFWDETNISIYNPAISIRSSLTGSKPALLAVSPKDANNRMGWLYHAGDELVFAVFRHDTQSFEGGTNHFRTIFNPAGSGHYVEFYGAAQLVCNNYVGAFSLEALQAIKSADGYYVGENLVLSTGPMPYIADADAGNIVSKFNTLMSYLRTMSLQTTP